MRVDIERMRVLDRVIDRKRHMIIGGLLLILLAYLFGAPLLYTLGVILAVAGVVIWILGSLGRAIGPRPHYW
ncbi:MAG TPA: hypothetical protein VK960_00690 [Acidimicrobiia bacterium]|nr:hypothetical protein [Acidimicrobiia bacterium]